ncbi:MAG: hypothetical protein LLF83_05845 [Methanobacterium sp.]|nr:hypothetical protein [Methanobacterium sp.]
MRKKVKTDEEEVLERKHAEEALNRKAKAGIHADVCTTPLKMAKGHIRKKPLVKTITCKKCGKSFKTNSDRNLCFDCQKN